MNIITGIPPKLPNNTYVTIDADDWFWHRVDIKDTNECWEWKEHKLHGYGYITLNKKDRRAHRIAWQLAYGNIPDDLFVLHTCDNRSCVNPNHLYLGTHIDNMRDVKNRHRNPGGHGLPAGENHPQAKLSNDNILCIRQERTDTNISYRLLTKKYNVSSETIWRVVNFPTRIDK